MELYSNRGTISNCNSTGAVTSSSSSVGGLVGWSNYYGTLTACYATGSVSGFAYTGGLVGENSGCSLTSCYATGSVIGRGSGSGGLVGYIHDSNISNCYSTGSVIGTGGRSGGLVGHSHYGNISDCYSTGVVSGSSNVGGLVGYNSPGTISSCYFLDTSGLNNGYGTPLTDEQMKQQASFVGWDFVWETVNGPNDIWAICEGVSYPKLAWQFVAGDSDNDKDVNFIDFAVMGNKWMQADSNLYCGGTDLTGDGWVDLEDFAVFADNWLAGI